MNIFKNKKIYIVLFIILFLGCIIFAVVSGESNSNGIEDFPESYKPYLEELSKKHPNWKFTALYTNLDWSYVIDNENEFGKNLVPKNYSDRWKNTNPRRIQCRSRRRLGRFFKASSRIFNGPKKFLK